VADLNIAQDTPNPAQQPQPAPDANKPQGEAPANATAALAFDEGKHPRADDGKFGSGGGAKKEDAPAKKEAAKTGETARPKNPAEAFKAKHGRDPTFEELHSGKGGLIEKLDKFDKANPKPSHSIRDVTPEGFGPTDSGHDANKPDPERLPAPDATTVQNLKNSIADAQTILKGKLTPEKQAQIHASLEATKKKLEDLQNHEPTTAPKSETGGKGGEQSAESVEKPATREEWSNAVDELERTHAKRLWGEMNKRWDSGDSVQFNTMTKATNAEAKHRDLFRQIGREIQMRQGKGWVSLKGQSMDTMAHNMGINPRLDYPERPDEAPTGHDDGWETRAEYAGDDPDFKEAREKYHREMVEDAIKFGRDVPKRILADYPDLAPSK
jgi:hypothetical protein